VWADLAFLLGRDAVSHIKSGAILTRLSQLVNKECTCMVKSASFLLSLIRAQSKHLQQDVKNNSLTVPLRVKFLSAIVICIEVGTRKAKKSPRLDENPA
jgi:hypothetical protein